MIKRFIATALLSAVLGGCVLQSRAPRFGEAEAVLALGESGGRALMSSWQNNKWVADSEPVEIKVKDHHYEAVAKDGSVTLQFVPLAGGWFVIQASDPKNPAIYMLAEVKQKAAEARPLACSDLKKSAEAASSISFEGDDCYIKPEADAKLLFATLMKSPGQATSRLEIVP